MMEYVRQQMGTIYRPSLRDKNDIYRFYRPYSKRIVRLPVQFGFGGVFRKKINTHLTPLRRRVGHSAVLWRRVCVTQETANVTVSHKSGGGHREKNATTVLGHVANCVTYFVYTTLSRVINRTRRVMPTPRNALIPQIYILISVTEFQNTAVPVKHESR